MTDKLTNDQLDALLFAILFGQYAASSIGPGPEATPSKVYALPDLRTKPSAVNSELNEKRDEGTRVGSPITLPPRKPQALVGENWDDKLTPQQPSEKGVDAGTINYAQPRAVEYSNNIQLEMSRYGVTNAMALYKAKYEESQQKLNIADNKIRELNRQVHRSIAAAEDSERRFKSSDRLLTAANEEIVVLRTQLEAANHLRTKAETALLSRSVKQAEENENFSGLARANRPLYDALMPGWGLSNSPSTWEGYVSEVDIRMAVLGVVEELHKAYEKHEDYNSPHEAYAVILEELDEYWTHVKGNTGKSAGAREELLQVAATALRAVIDIWA